MLLETTDLRSRQNVNVLADPAVSQMARVPLCLRVPGRKGGGRPERPLATELAELLRYPRFGELFVNLPNDRSVRLALQHLIHSLHRRKIAGKSVLIPQKQVKTA